MHTFHPNDYPTPFATLWSMDRLPTLGPGAPNMAAKPLLAALSLSDVPNLRDAHAAQACLSGLWLHHDFLDESHTISQDIGEWFGSYWHAIMHRREPDAWNSKYWFRRVPSNPVFESLATATPYDPSAFVDVCERERGTGSECETACQQFQLREMQTLFAWCWAKAIGG